MPIYEYRCPKCRMEFELMRPMSEMNEPASCPQCGAEGERLVSGFASRVGFYVKAPAKAPFRSSSGEGANKAGSKKTAKRKSNRGKTNDKGGKK